MAYGFDQIFAADPANPSNIAQNSSIKIFAPGDATQAPIALTDTSGAPLPNPVPVNANGFGPAFIAQIDRVAWAGGGFTGFFTSYEGLKEEAVAARDAAEAAATAATQAAGAASVAAENVIGTLVFPASQTVTYNPDGSVATVTVDGITTAYTYNGDGTVATDARTVGGETTTRIYTYTNGNLTGIEAA